MHTPAGVGTLWVTWDREGVVSAEAWGPGGEWLLDGLPGLLGAGDDPSDFAPRHAVVARLHHRHGALRLTRTGAVWNEAGPVVLEQRVTTSDAARSWARLVRALGEPAPGPLGLVAPPAPEVAVRHPAWAFHPYGIERRRADTYRRLAARASRLAALESRDPEGARRALRQVDGVGPWTAASLVVLTHGDPDTVVLGDSGLPGIVGWALAGDARAGDDRMLDLLEPFRGHRWRVVRLLFAGGLLPPRRAPRQAHRPIDRW